MTTSRAPGRLLLPVLLLALGASSARAQTAPPADLDAWVERARKEFEVPGFALAIVKDGKVVVARGYGLREIGKPTPVNERTLFGIASNTKAFTATALAMLVDEGKLEWDAPVVRYLPWFQLADPYVTRELTVRDLLVHRSGLSLGAGDLLWWPPTRYERKELVRQLRHLPLATSFRSTYAYDNVLYLVAGELLEAVSGQSWEDFVSSRILARVGMEDSTAHAPGGGANVATPCARVDGAVQPVTPFAAENINPAAGIKSNARDIARWMLVQLGAGKLPDGSPLFSPARSQDLWTPVTPIPLGDPPPELAGIKPNFRGYALGFMVRDYRGHKLIHHGGALPGYLSQVTLLPELGLGVAVLTNQESGELLNAITYRVLDHYLGAPPIDWIAAFGKIRARSEAKTREAENKIAATREAGSRPPLPLSAYAGTYTDPWYGDVKIALESGRLVMRFGHSPLLVGDLEPWQHDTFVARWRDRTLRADAFVTFALTPDGGIDQVKMRAFSPATDFSFDFQDLRLSPAPPRKAVEPVSVTNPPGVQHPAIAQPGPK